MKKAIVSVLSIVVVLTAVLISMKYFRGGNQFSVKQQVNEEVESNEPKQERKIDEKSIAFAEKVNKAMDYKYNVDPENVVPMGKKMKEGMLTYQVKSWEITKKKPDYPLPEGMMLPEEYMTDESFGAEFDAEGNFLNGFSYVVVNMVVENNGDRPTEGIELYWHMFWLKKVGYLGKSTGELKYLGEKQPRKYTKQYTIEILQPGEKIEMPLIYIIDDEMLEGEGFCLQVNRGAGMPEERCNKFYISGGILMLE